MSHFEERMQADLNIIRERLWKIGEDVNTALYSATCLNEHTRYVMNEW